MNNTRSEDFEIPTGDVLKIPKFEVKLRSLNLIAHFTQATEVISMAAGKHLCRCPC